MPLISFTGGTVTGAAVMRAAGPIFKRVSLELGGKNAAVVFADADLDATVAGRAKSSFENQGEICLCSSRIFVERPNYEAFRRRFVEAVAGLRIGPPSEADTQIGALISEAHLRKVESYIAWPARRAASSRPAAPANSSRDPTPEATSSSPQCSRGSAPTAA